MTRYLARQAIALVALLLVGSFIVFGVLALAPGDPIAALIGNQTATPELVAELEARYNLDQPFLIQYGKWLSAAATGDFGTSIVFQSDVGDLIGEALPVSIALIVMAEAFVVLFGVTAAIVAVRRPGAPAALVAMATSVSVSVPVFVFAVVSAIVFGRILSWFPTVGAGDGGWDRLHHLFLPAVSIAIAASALLARVGQSAMRAEIESPHVTTEEARGVGSTRLFRRHVLRNALPPMLTVVALQVPALIAGTVVVERAFNLGGVGSLLLAGISAGDFPLVQAIALITIAVTVSLGVLVDVAYAILDPRVSIGASR